MTHWKQRSWTINWKESSKYSRYRSQKTKCDTSGKNTLIQIFESHMYTKGAIQA